MPTLSYFYILVGVKVCVLQEGLVLCLLLLGSLVLKDCMIIDFITWRRTFFYFGARSVLGAKQNSDVSPNTKIVIDKEE